MRTFSITGVRLRRRVRTTVSDPSAALVPDLFRRDFTAPEPGIKYMGDITYLPLENEEFLYLATVLDCFSRKAVGWFIADRIRTDLVADALKMAARTRGGLDGTVFHSDRGAQYGARVFAALCDQLGVTRSMGEVGSSADYAACGGAVQHLAGRQGGTGGVEAGGHDGAQGRCMAHIKEVWMDMRPLSLRRHMEAAAAQNHD